MSRKRAPDGVVTGQPIALRLLPDELDAIKHLAQAEQRPLANMCRLLVLRGLKDFKREQASQSSSTHSAT